MVNFSDLKDDRRDAKKNLPRNGHLETPQKSRLSFSRLDKEKEGIVSGAVSVEEETGDESRKAVYEAAAEYLTSVFNAIKGRQRFSLEPAIRIVQKIIDVQLPKDPLLIKAIHSEDPYGFLISNCVNVAIFAIKIAENLGFSRNRRIEIGLAGLLHEVGMGVIPEKLIYKKEKLSEREFDLFKKRTEYSYKILSTFGREHAYLAETAVQLQERIDGSGYPMGLKGEEISEYAQIIGLVDMYEALIHSRPQRERFLHFSAVKEIIKTGKRRFQKKYIKALLNIFSIFPLGSYVKLNSNAIGKVIETHPEQPMRPEIQIVIDSQGRRVLVERLVDLKENSILFIVDSVSEEEVRNLSEGFFDASFSEDKLPEAPSDDERLSIPDREALAYDGLPSASEMEDGVFSSVSPKEKIETITNIDLPRSKRRRRQRPGRLKPILMILALIMIVIGILWQSGIIGRSDPEGRSPLLRPAGEAQGDKTKKTPAVTKRKPSPLKLKNLPTSVPLKADQTVPAALQAPGEPPVAGPEISAKPAGKIMPDIPPPVASFPYSIKLIYFRTLREARDSLPGFAAKGLSPYWVKVNLGDQGTWYRVFAGHFKNVQEAETLINEKQLQGAVVKQTGYTTLIDSAFSEDELRDQMTSLSQSGFSPYVIKDNAGVFRLYVGAFYTQKGARDQQSELSDKGFQGKIVAR